MGSNFIDKINVLCRSGKGGKGSTYLHRDKLTRFGGPMGGDGGNGGDVLVKGNRNLWTLHHLRYTKHLFAQNGEDGGKQRMHGMRGKDAIVQVPLGTIIRTMDGEWMGEITTHDEELILLNGGLGGRGNWHFKTPTNRTPRYAQPGEEGIEQWLTLELKVLADVGLVGFPNAGKSTLLATVSAAKPKIANYPFTTLTPNVGIVSYRDDLSFVMADIPGIIEGAHQGKGLGVQFLRHIERNALLLFLVAADEENVLSAYQTLLAELEQYNVELLDKKRFVVISKKDIIGEEKIESITQKMGEIPHLFISSVTGFHVAELKEQLWHMLNETSE